MKYSPKNLLASLILASIGAIALLSCSPKTADKEAVASSIPDFLADSISQIVAQCPGEVGVALIVNSEDTVTVNDSNVYPMMSVFKLHQALAVGHRFDREALSLDSVLTLNRATLDPDTWSPMLRDHAESVISIPVSGLLRYALVQSDNNASNVMFRSLCPVEETDSFISTVIPRNTFRIAHMEAEMAADHALACDNSTSPLGAAMLINRLFTDSVISPANQNFIRQCLGECVTGKDRIAAPLLGKEGVTIAHKTGSGFSEGGVLAAHNDVAYITLPNGVSYSLAVFVKDFKGNEPQASAVVARISRTVYDALSQINETSSDN